MERDLGRLISKAKSSLAEDGFWGLTKKTRNYLKFRIATRGRSEEMKDILFINGCGLKHPERYRVDHQMEQLESCGLSVDKVFYTYVKPEMLKYFRAVIVFRCPITPEIKKLIEKARYFNKKVFFDVDDLVIDKKYTDQIEYVRQMNKDERRMYDDGVVKMGETLKMCDFCITSTSALARELRKYGKEVYINRNVANEIMVKLSLNAANNAVRNNNKVRIGYLSGSITHNPDFEMVMPVLANIMAKYPQVELVVMGHLDIPKGLDGYKDRIIQQPFKDWQELPKIIAELDINLAPIEETLFNEAKSENKWTEASLCKVVTVASDFGAFREVIEDGKTGFLCKNEDDWYNKIRLLVEDAGLRKRVAEKAYNRVIKEYVTTYSGRGLAEYIESKLAKNIAFILPSTNVSGGVNVVLKHCNLLRQNGWDAMVINMDVSDDNMISEDGEINVISGVKHSVFARFDEMVATLYTTVRYVKEYPSVSSRRYLVQGFETDFNDYGSPVKREANATYHEDMFRYLTVSKWCEKWLKDDYGQAVRYAPNGIDLDKFSFHKRKWNGKIKILIEGNSDDYYKNVDESFKIVAKLDPKRYEIVYLSYQGEPKEWYRIDKFYHKVPHDQVGKIYEECNILLKTSVLESFSYPPLEMMATGGCVVAIPNVGNEEYLRDGENCLFYERGEIDVAVDCIERIVENFKLRNRLVENGRKVAEERDWKKIEDKILELYK